MAFEPYAIPMLSRGVKEGTFRCSTLVRCVQRKDTDTWTGQRNYADPAKSRPARQSTTAPTAA